jgi:hypothetical protein
MARTGAKRVGRRIGRPTRLLVIGLTLSLSATVAIAAIALSARHSADRSGDQLAIHAEPASRTVAPGTSAQFTVRVARRDSRLGLSGRTGLQVGALPSGTSASFTTERGLTSRRATTLTVATAADTPPGTYTLQVRAQRPHRSGSTAVGLVVTDRGSTNPAPAADPSPPVTTPDAFTIAGSLPSPLTPGSAVPLDLILTNRESLDLSISSLDVSLASVGGPQSDSSHPCSAGDFLIEQFSGAPGAVLRGSSTASLGELGFAPAEWPQVSMLNLPVNQDGCKQASLSLSFSGSATEVAP